MITLKLNSSNMFSNLIHILLTLVYFSVLLSHAYNYGVKFNNDFTIFSILVREYKFMLFK